MTSTPQSKSELDQAIGLEARSSTIRTCVSQLREQIDTADIVSLKLIIDQACQMQADAAEIRLRALAGYGRLRKQLGSYKRPYKRPR